MDREDPFDAFALDEVADGDHFADAGAAAGDHGAAEYLRPLLLAVEELLVNIDRVADAEIGHIGFFIRGLNDLE